MNIIIINLKDILIIINSHCQCVRQRKASLSIYISLYHYIRYPSFCSFQHCSGGQTSGTPRWIFSFDRKINIFKIAWKIYIFKIDQKTMSYKVSQGDARVAKCDRHWSSPQGALHLQSKVTTERYPNTPYVTLNVEFLNSLLHVSLTVRLWMSGLIEFTYSKLGVPLIHLLPLDRSIS